MIETVILAKAKLATSITNVFLSQAPQITTKPYITINKVSAPRGETHEGRDGTVVARFQLDIYGDSYQQVKLLAGLAYSLCEQTDTSIASIELENEFDDYETDTKLFRVVLDFIVRHYE